MVTMPRVATVVATTVLALLAGGAPAAAHTRAAAADNYDSRITATTTLDGVRWRTYASGDLLEVTVTADVEVIVTGYEGEPYLRITPQGVAANRNSPATYLNGERYGDVALPPRADASAAPEWMPVASSPTYAWHDHRVHWMGSEPPPGVGDAPRRTQLVQHWTVEALVDGRPYRVDGELWWVPGRSALPWLAVALVLTAPAAAGLGAWRRRARSGAGESLAGRLAVVRLHVRPAAAVVGAVAVLNGLHFVDEVAAWPVPTLDIAFGVLHNALFVGAGILGAAIAWRATQGPFLSLGIASGAVLFHQGLLQWRMLTASQLPTVWPTPLLRLAVALSLTQAAWITAVLVSGMRAAGRQPQAAADPAPPNPTAQVKPPLSAPSKGAPMVTRLLALLALALLAIGCSGDGTAPVDEPAEPAVGEGGEVAIDVVMGDIFYQPTGVEIPAGTTLIVHARNEGNLDHDFALDTGESTGLLSAGEEVTAEFGPIQASTVAYCTVPGHRESGMEFDITVTN
jgi:uncharacterized cupredoxin-like copper-binding protein